MSHPEPRNAFVSPRFGQIATFMLLPAVATAEGLDVALVGIPYDGGVSYRTGARFGPRAVREQSSLIRPWHPVLKVHPFERLRVADCGDVDVAPISIERTYAAIERRVNEILAHGAVPVSVGGDHSSAFNTAFVLGGTAIPAGASEFEISGQYPIPLLGGSTLATNILLYEMSPHMHLRGSRFRYEVIYPNGTREVLLSVPHYIFHWQRLYRLTQPKYIPKGSRILCTAGWDNTILNGALMDSYSSSGDARFSPNRSVSFGEQTYDEMFIGYMDYSEAP